MTEILPGPPSLEAGSLQTLLDGGVGAHEPPNQVAAGVLHHRQDGNLVDADVVRVEPEPREMCSTDKSK